MRQVNKQQSKPKRAPWRGVWWLALSLLLGCGSPFAGGWQGTMDVGPVLAHSVTVQMPPEGLEGDLTVQTTDGEKVYQICKAKLTADKFELSFDRLNPDCVADKDAQTDLHTLRGTLGEGVIFGEMFRDKRKIGFFRAFRKPPAAPDIAQG